MAMTQHRFSIPRLKNMMASRSTPTPAEAAQFNVKIAAFSSDAKATQAA